MNSIKVKASATIKVAKNVNLVEIEHVTHIQLPDGTLLLPIISYMEFDGVDTWVESDIEFGDLVKEDFEVKKAS